jgi:Skp family chaperone for outer membrane proteins
MVCGEYQPTTGKDRKPFGDPIPNYYPRIISDDTYYKAQNSLNSRVRHRGPTSKFVNILGGLVVDAASQSPMYMGEKKQRDGIYQKRIYPSAAINGGAKYWSMPVDLLEKAVLDIVTHATLKDEPSQDETTLQGLEAKRDTLKAKIEKATTDVDADYEAMKKFTRNLQNALNETEEAIEEYKTKLSNRPKDALTQAVEAIKTEDRLFIRAKLRSLVKGIEVSKEDVVVEFVSGGKFRFSDLTMVLTGKQAEDFAKWLKK